MKLIITGVQTFTDYPRLCQVLAPDRHRITQVLTGGARGAEQLGYRWAWKHTVKGLDHGIGHLIEITPQKRSDSTSVRVERKKRPRHP